jgi:erythromycin esterase-like protein
MRQLKAISVQAVPAALEKALRYRLLNEPMEVESICLDVLLVDPKNQQALVTMLLATTDQFEDQYGAALERANAVLPRLASEYERAYYEGIIHERWAKAESARGVPSHVVTGWFLQAMHCYERAEALAPPDNPDAILRWNTCARLLDREAGALPVDESMTHDVEAEFGDEAPTR